MLVCFKLLWVDLRFCFGRFWRFLWLLRHTLFGYDLVVVSLFVITIGVG